MPAARRYSLALVALLCVALLAFWALSRPDRRGASAPPDVPVEGAGEATPTLVGRNAEHDGILETVPPGPTTPDAVPEQVVVVTVLDRDTAEPLENAEVSVVKAAPGSGELLVVPTPHVLHRGTTNAVGQASLTLPSRTRHPAQVVAIAPGFASMHVAVQGEASLTLRLPPAKTITGRVVDTDGRPVQGITVRARAVEVPDLEDDLVAAVANSAWRGTLTDAEGRFEVGGLWSGTYVVTAYGDGWRLEDPALGKMDQQIHHTAGATGVEFVVRPVRVFRLQIRDKALDCPIPIAYWSDVSFTVEETAGIAVGQRLLDQHEYRLFDGVRWITVGSAEGDPSVFVSYVDLIAGEEVEDTARVIVEVPGYLGEITTVHLLTPSELRTTQKIDRLVLEPAPERGLPIGRGRVLVEEAPSEAGYWRTPWRELILDESGGARRTIVLRGQVQGPEAWIFHHAPEGHFEARVREGNVTRSAVRVEIRAGETTVLRLPREDPTGITFDVRDGADNLIHGIDFLVAYPEPGPSTPIYVPIEYSRPAWDRTREALLPRVFPLPPGSYLITAEKEGYGRAQARGHVQAGQVYAVRIAFATKRSER